MNEKDPLWTEIALSPDKPSLPDLPGIDTLSEVPIEERDEAIATILSLTPEELASIDREVLNGVNVNFNFFRDTANPAEVAQAIRTFLSTDPKNRAEEIATLRKLIK